MNYHSSYKPQSPENEHNFDLFSTPKHEEPSVQNNPERHDLRSKAAEWINDNPKVMKMFLDLARKAAAKEMYFGIGFLTEIVRWTYSFEYNTNFKICNNHRAYIARWLIKQDPSLEKYMRFRTTNYFKFL